MDVFEGTVFGRFLVATEKGIERLAGAGSPAKGRGSLRRGGAAAARGAGGRKKKNSPGERKEPEKGRRKKGGGGCCLR